MKIYLKSRKGKFNAIAEFNPKSNTFMLLKGTKVNDEVKDSPTFRGSKTIEARRKGKLKNFVLLEDTEFKSLSTMANFVTGCSTNGLRAWKTENGESLKDYLKK